MSVSQFRLPEKPDRLYSGQMLDRSRALSFTLDGVEFEGFHGDTVLSAVLASGADQFGHFRGQPVGLDDRLHPPVAPVASAGDPRAALAMSRTAAVDGMELASLADLDPESAGIRQRLERKWERLRGRTPTSLMLDPESISPFPGPWTELEAEANLSADLIVVGAGVGGLSAARAGADRGWRVILVEQMTMLGGDASFFGSEEGEGRAADMIAELIGDVKSAPRTTIFTDTEVFGFSAGTLRAHQTLDEGKGPRARVVALRGTHVVLAPGAHERLPLFAGNRLPGVSGARSAHRLASNFGVWRGETAIINTASSAATQVALQAADMGIQVLRLVDTRSNPQSRFFDFAKAYGVPLATGTSVESVGLVEDRQLEVNFELTASGKAEDSDTGMVDRLLICGGWQSDLTLWNMAGGRAEWDRDRQHLRASGTLENVALAGWCDGAMTFTNCVTSGENAVLALSGSRPVRPAPGLQHAPMESDDGQLPVSRPTQAYPSCYLDNGYSFSVLKPAPHNSSLLKSALGLGQRQLEPELRALSLNDVSAKVLLGDIDPDISGEFARERCVVPGLLETGISAHRTAGTSTISEDAIPAFLEGRFGPNAGTVYLSVEDGQGVEAGCLIFRSSNETHPGQALGVVLRQNSDAPGKVCAYVDLQRFDSASRCLARAGKRTVELRFSDADGAN